MLKLPDLVDSTDSVKFYKNEDNTFTVDVENMYRSYAVLLTASQMRTLYYWLDTTLDIT